MTTGCTTNVKVVQPVVSDRNNIDITTSRETVPQMARPIAWSPCQLPDQSCDMSPTIIRDRWHDPVRLVARSCTTCLRPLTICNRRSRVLNMTIDLAATKFARTSPTTSKINRTIILWSYIGRNMVASPVWLGLNWGFVLGNSTYSTCCVQAVVTQGSVLGPLFFVCIY